MNSDIALSGSMPNGNKSGMMQSFSGIKSDISLPRTFGSAPQGICLGGPSSIYGDGTFGRHLQVGVTQSLADGSPSVPSLQLNIPGFWRFRWSVTSGSHMVSLLAKQTDSTQRPSVVVKANSIIGINNDVSGSAPAGSGWVTVGPVTVAPTGSGMIWVELWNNCQTINCPALFDHIVTT
jgi:hypothetical protein